MEPHTNSIRRHGWWALPATLVLVLAPFGSAHAASAPSTMRDNPSSSLPADPAAAAPTAVDVLSVAVERLLDDAHADSVHSALADLRR